MKTPLNKLRIFSSFITNKNHIVACTFFDVLYTLSKVMKFTHTNKGHLMLLYYSVIAILYFVCYGKLVCFYGTFD